METAPSLKLRRPGQTPPAQHADAESRPLDSASAHLDLVCSSTLSLAPLPQQPASEPQPCGPHLLGSRQRTQPLLRHALDALCHTGRGPTLAFPRHAACVGKES